MANILFTSYAHDNRDEYLDLFIEELTSELLQVGSIGKQDIVFLDRTGIRSGEDWVHKLSAAVSSCKVCVAVCSPAFAASRYCGKELRVFLDRLAQWMLLPTSPAVAARPIFPVLWVKRGPLPAVLQPFQRVDAAFPQEYAKEGLRIMYRLSKYAEARKEVVTALAACIADAFESVDLPASGPIPHFDHIPSAFHEQEQSIRYGVVVVPLMKSEMHTVPYDGQPSLLSVVQTACGGRIPFRVVTQDKTLSAQLRRAEQSGEVTIVVTDLEILSDPLYRGVVDCVNQDLGAHSALLLLRREAGAATAQADRDALVTVEGALGLALKRAAQRDLQSIRSADELRRKFEGCAVSLRQQRVAADPALRAESLTIASAAAAEGIPVEQLTGLAGPGAVLQ